MGSCQSISVNDTKGDLKQKGKPQLIIKSFTWARDSHGLFDYESKILTKKNMKINSSGKILRNGEDVIVNRENDPLEESESKSNTKSLLRMSIKDGTFWIGSCIDLSKKKAQEDWEDNDHSVWLVVKSLKSNGTNKNGGYKLNEGDLMKLGRIKFRVKELRNSPQNNNQKKSDKSDKDKKATDKEEDVPLNESQRRGSKASVAGSATSVAQQTCRICLGDQGDAEDPFFSPCHCSGTMKYIHVLCLQRWLKSKLHVKQTPFSTSIYWKTLECELCKTTFPSSFDIAGRKYDAVEIDRPDCGYLMLEVLSKEKNILRGIHIIKIDGKSNIRLGRGHDSDIRITDISVSRCHAIIKMDKGNFYIEDNNSKFGTLVHFRKPFPLNGDYNNISVQVGRTVLSLSVKKNWKSFSGCFGGVPVREPTEIDEEEMLFRRESRPHYAEPDVILNRRARDMEESLQRGVTFDIENNREGQGAASPIAQEVEDIGEDRLSEMSDEFPENIPPTENQNVANGERVEGADGQPPAGQQREVNQQQIQNHEEQLHVEDIENMSQRIEQNA